MADGEDAGGGEGRSSCRGVTDAGDRLEACVSACRKLYTERKFSDCVTKVGQHNSPIDDECQTQSAKASMG